ncbi:hypothetical protein OSB04_015343 [Centaurea solstitialis]|uniref:cyclin-dependent kinase n=1 Tax=Centaurea solstitialis TaxID=347529 RepID=A0AA38T6N9_9ASTR|nr:hypothetical protein OSB04_015343 [Centaurea solstitialis]
MDPPPPPSTTTTTGKSWSIHTRREITSKYQIQSRIGSGAYSDVYRARRISDDLPVALKEVHDYQSAFREIEALQTLQHSPNVVVLHEYFWSEDEDAVLVLEYLPADLSTVIRTAKKEGLGLGVGEIKRWIVQILLAVDACHRSSIIHRDLKPSNLLISAEGVLKLADFGQARIRLAPGFVSCQRQHTATGPDSSVFQQDKTENIGQESRANFTEGPLGTIEEYGPSDEFKTRDAFDEVDKESNIPDSTRASFWVHELWGGNRLMVSRLHHRRAFHFGTDFSGVFGYDQLGRIFMVLGNLSEEVWPGCVQLPDFRIISFSKVENPSGLDSCLPGRSQDENFSREKAALFRSGRSSHGNGTASRQVFKRGAVTGSGVRA